MVDGFERFLEGQWAGNLTSLQAASPQFVGRNVIESLECHGCRNMRLKRLLRLDSYRNTIHMLHDAGEATTPQVPSYCVTHSSTPHR